MAVLLARIVFGSHRSVDAALPSRGSDIHLTDALTSSLSVSEISAMKRGLTSISTFAMPARRIIDSSKGKVARNKIFPTRNLYPTYRDFISI